MDSTIIQSQCIGKVELYHESIDAEIKQLPSNLWTEHVNRSNYEGVWSVLALRTLKVNELSHPILQCYQIEHGDEWVDLPIVNTATSIYRLINAIPFAKKSIRLMKLEAGALIKEHRDLGLNIENGEGRFHIPLQSSEQVHFTSNGEVLHMHVGELWYINADAPHSVRNMGVKPRINLVIDCSLSREEWHRFIHKDTDNGKS
ncbi:aspartyl/asparaginyl beta-hydroxylase domain-containing protein [Shewanella sp. 10N.286.45.A1]|uniref:aspartyl/asparaginyl beta-hydroxylase domain-containing protein n=1 Tax=Shewanella sp. 10N.286.45.A1 TaxID=3229694 RepID=UPI0035514ACE